MLPRVAVGGAHHVTEQLRACCCDGVSRLVYVADPKADDHFVTVELLRFGQFRTRTEYLQRFTRSGLQDCEIQISAYDLEAKNVVKEIDAAIDVVGPHTNPGNAMHLHEHNSPSADNGQT